MCTLPEQFIDLGYPARNHIDYNMEADAFLQVINEANKESDVQRYIKTNKKWFVPGSLFKNYDFGHHEAYLVSEQQLGAEYKADYMLLGRNSVGYHIVFVEFEDVNVDYKLSSSNSETESVRKGLVQIQDWKRWMDDNRAYFFKSAGLTNISGNIPTWGISYCLVVGRRSRMNGLANQMRGQKMHETPGLQIVSYDRLVDNIRQLSNGF